MRPIRVLEIISGFAIEGPLGGIERFGITLAKALDRSVVEPIVCGLWAYDTPFEQGWVKHLRAQGITAFIAANWQEASPYNAFGQALKGIRAAVPGPVDGIHSHCQFGDLAALWLKRPLKAQKLYRTVHNEREWGKRPLRRAALTNLLYPLTFSHELGVAQAVVNKLDNRPVARLLHRRAIRAYNAIDFTRFANVQVNKQALRKQLGLSKDAFVVGSIGRLVEQKGYHVLLTAVPELLTALPQAQFVIIGDGERREELVTQANALGIKDNVHFFGARQDVEKLIQVFDLFIAPSLWEGLPTVLMESMAAGIPVLATAVSGTTEIVQDKKTGWLIPVNDPQAIVNAIIHVVNVPQHLRNNIIDNARQFVHQRFSIEAVARQYEHIYTTK